MASGQIAVGGNLVQELSLNKTKEDKTLIKTLEISEVTWINIICLQSQHGFFLRELLLMNLFRFFKGISRYLDRLI